jgi:hypothetical protein
VGPGWAESFVLTLARETGWSEDFILRRIPMSKALKYWHAAVWGQGAWTTKETHADPEQRASVEELLAAVRINREDDES